MGLYEYPIESWKSCTSFLYSTQGKNPTQTVSDLIFVPMLQSVQNTVSATPSSSENRNA
jgi:hypothetical protein